MLDNIEKIEESDIILIGIGSEFEASRYICEECAVKALVELKNILGKKNYFVITTCTNNILLEASMEDHRNDCIITTFTLISVLLSLKGINWFDSIVGIGISAWICKTGIEIFLESYNILMDISIDEDTKDIILDLNGKTIKYSIYDIFVTDPNDVSILLPKDEVIREVTLITCTNGNKQRLILKAKEI